MSDPLHSTTTIGSEFSAKMDLDPPEGRAVKFAYLDGVAGIEGIRRLRSRARDELALRPGSRVLDVGSGLGEVARDLAQLVQPGGRVVALDRSTEITAAAAARHDGGPVEYVVGDAGALDFPSDSFDAARAERVLQHLPDPDLAIREMVRVVQPGGRICLVDTDWSSLTADGVPQPLFDDMSAFVRNYAPGRDNRMGLSLRRRLIAAGGRSVHAEPFVVATSDVRTAAELVMIFDPPRAGSLGLIAPELAPAWATAVAEAVERDELLVALTIWVVSGRV
ncbi:MAG TPA: methyltransferase domain-containing protein [Actinoplanes sp.]|nr:methyltransferase domain-containing protein [Actinoplanes sp.]